MSGNEEAIEVSFANLSITRPTFSYLKDNNKPIRAGGVIIYRKINNQIEFLLIKKLIGNIERYEDIGGKTDKEDIDELDTIARETFEETNNIISQSVIKKQLEFSKSCYNLKSKYVLYFIKANKYEKKLKAEIFGNVELHDSIHRTIEWVNSKLIIDKIINLHPRLILMIHDIKKYILNLQTVNLTNVLAAPL
jgi:8-oxo-dGTP pyrophosphatase MutT (NUDIX family)